METKKERKDIISIFFKQEVQVLMISLLSISAIEIKYEKTKPIL